MITVPARGCRPSTTVGGVSEVGLRNLMRLSSPGEYMGRGGLKCEHLRSLGTDKQTYKLPGESRSHPVPERIKSDLRPPRASACLGTAVAHWREDSVLGNVGPKVIYPRPPQKNGTLCFIILLNGRHTA